MKLSIARALKALPPVQSEADTSFFRGLIQRLRHYAVAGNYELTKSNVRIEIHPQDVNLTEHEMSDLLNGVINPLFDIRFAFAPGSAGMALEVADANSRYPDNAVPA